MAQQMKGWLLNTTRVLVVQQENLYQENPCIEAAARRCSVKKVFLEISQNSQENTCARVSFLIKLQAFVNFGKFLRTPFLTEHLRWLLLHV